MKTIEQSAYSTSFFSYIKRKEIAYFWVTEIHIFKDQKIEYPVAIYILEAKLLFLLRTM